ncbi:MAG TPA: RNase adapter RapZ [Vicinamibacterales bacterium]|nr:RNase adapter RapZ [Vicinamibacterales bacterium]HPW21896.1 RNase adapter RapZ [Vicinamibacterales bacterium]
MATRTKDRRGSRRALQARLVIVTGLSGAGKSHAIRALEDLGYFCVDNLPTLLIPTMAGFATRAGSEIEKVAIVVDVREGAFLSDFARVYRRVRRMPGLDAVLIFLEASDAALLRRFSETRRPHPLAHDRPVLDGIRDERRRLARIRAMADEILDTSSLTVYDLRDVFAAHSRGGGAPGRPLQATIVSFGFKHGIPVEADLLFDVRFLPNPFFQPRLRPLTGRDRRVAAFMRAHPLTQETIRRIASLLQFLVPHYADEGKSYLTIGIGCTGGQHRSVFIAEALRRALGPVGGVRFHVRHRDLASAGEPGAAGRRRQGAQT